MHAIYDKYVGHAQGGDINLPTDAVKAYLIDLAQYTPNLATDDTIANIPAGARAAEVTLTGVTLTDRTVDADSATFPAVPGGPALGAIVYTVGATEYLYKINDEATGLPVTPNGGDINLNINAAGIADL